MSFNSLLNKTCSIYYSTTTFSASGTGNKSYTARTTSARCAIQPKSGNYFSGSYSEDEKHSHKGYFLMSESVVAGDKVVQGSASYIVVSVNNGSGRNHHQEVLLEQLS